MAAGTNDMNRDGYIEHLRERLKIAEAIIEKATVAKGHQS